MRITAGLGCADDWKAYRAAGADECFIGYVPLKWQRERLVTSPLNRREVICCGAQAGLENELERLAEAGAAAAITLNSLSYRPEEYPLVAEIIENCLSMGFDSFIIADPALIVYLHMTGLVKRIRLHVSGEFGEMNRYTLKELRRLGAKRIIMNRKVTIAEMEALTTGGLEYEAFFMNERCHYSGAFCDSLHCDGLPPLCREEYRFSAAAAAENGGMDGCGLCALPLLRKAGITHLKIVGRGAATEDMISSIRLAKTAVSLLESCADEREYLERLKKELPEGSCGKKCYYL